MSLILWAAAGVVAMLLDGGDRSLIALAIISMSFGAWAFWRNGGTRITGAGLYCLAMSVFVGFAAAWWWDQGQATGPIYVATLAGWWTTYAMYALFWHAPPSNAPPLRATASDVTSWGIAIGLAVSVAGFALGVSGYGNLTQFSLGGLGLVMVSLILHNTRGERIGGPLILTALVVLAFWLLVFTGGGRLNLVALGMVGLVLTSTRMGDRRLKAAALAGTGPAVSGLALLEARYTDAPIGVAEGLASVVNPLRYFGELTTAHEAGRFTMGYGDTFLASALFWVPRDLWADKPDGFGAVLTGILRPDYKGSGWSLAALSCGEWFYNFGWLGVVGMVAAIGLAVRSLDRATARVQVVDSRRSLLWLTALLLLLAAIPTLAWVGTFTYVARIGQQMIPLAALALPFASRRAQDARDDRPVRPALRRRSCSPPEWR